MTPATIRRLRADDVALYRDARLAALLEAPEAFCSTHADATERSEESWREQVEAGALDDRRALFVGLRDERVVAMAALYVLDDEQPSVTEMLQVWVAPDQRGGSLGVDLMGALVTWARGAGFTSIVAEVRIANERAVRFYRRYGFAITHELDDVYRIALPVA